MLILFVSIYSQNKKYIKCSYDFIYNQTNYNKNIDSLKKTNNLISEKYSKKIEEAMINSQDYIKFEMIASENESIFYSFKNMVTENQNIMNRFVIDNYTKISLYNNKENKETFSLIDILNTNFLVDINIGKNVTKKFTNESKIINNLECYKVNVFDNNKFILSAWYCPTINFNGGPEYCYDLPGLVLEVNYPVYSIVCKIISFDVTEADIMKIKKQKGVYITKDELNEKIKKAKENLKKLQKGN
jgi:GLPGLI family protein